MLFVKQLLSCTGIQKTPPGEEGSLSPLRRSVLLLAMWCRSVLLPTGIAAQDANNSHNGVDG